MLSSIESLLTVMEQCCTYQRLFSWTASAGGMIDVAPVVGAGATCTHYVRELAGNNSAITFNKTV